MAKSFSSKKLLAATDPSHLKTVAIGSFLSFFVFLGAFLTTDAALQIFLGKSALSQAVTYSCGDNCVSSTPTTQSPSISTTYPKAYTLDRNGNMYGDTNKDGKLSADEINTWNATHNADGSPKSQPSGGGGTGGGTPSSQTQTKTSSFYGEDTGCLSATGCDGAGNY